MTNFEQVKHKYEEVMHGEDHSSQSYRLLCENKELLEMNKFYLDKIKEKDKSISELELAVAEFVDVRKKYIRQNILQIQKKVF